MSADTASNSLEKNNFYRDSYRRVLKGIFLLILLGLGLLSVIGYRIWNMPSPKYYATTAAGRVSEMTALDSPVITSHYLLQWAEMVARASYNFDFVSVSQKMDALSQYFTTDGWSSFSRAQQSAGLVQTVQDEKLAVSAVVDGSPIIADHYVSNGHYVWSVQVPLLVTYTSASDSRKTALLVTMTISRVPVLEVEKGIAVTNFVVGGR